MLRSASTARPLARLSALSLLASTMLCSAGAALAAGAVVTTAFAFRLHRATNQSRLIASSATATPAARAAAAQPVDSAKATGAAGHR